MKSLTKIPYSLYIHVPFCRQACSYCDFYFVTRQQLIPEYVQALLTDIALSAQHYRQDLGTECLPILTSVYFGGGTPSRLPAGDIARILAAIDKHHGLGEVREITLEANPDDLTTFQSVVNLKDAGITRLSMGIQSFDSELLQFMNRAHTAGQAANSIDFIRKADFNTFTVDLIYGNPGQSLSQLETDIRTFLSYNPPHISAYALTIEPGTRLGKALKLGRLTEPDDHDVAQHMELVTSMLEDARLHRYEVSNFASPGHEAIHNSSYWNHTPYLGIGPGAHSLLMSYNRDVDQDTNSRHSTFTHNPAIRDATRWSSPADLLAYIRHYNDGIPAVNTLREGIEQLDTLELAEERILMGLRTRDGININELHRLYSYSFNPAQRAFLIKMQLEGLIKETQPDYIQLTSNGFKMADRITLEIISRGKQ